MAIAVGTDLSFRDMVRERSGENVHECFFCQKCTAGCPTAYRMDLPPAQLLRMIQLGQKDAVLASSTIWLCVSCHTCGTRCPNHIHLAPVADALRAMALEEGYAPDRAVYSLHRSFLDSISLWGRVHELSMLMEFKVRCLLAKPSLFFNGLVGDLMMAKNLVAKGKIRFVPERIEAVGDVKKLYGEAGE
jgi:heterodisulfide reductase subunit C